MSHRREPAGKSAAMGGTHTELLVMADPFAGGEPSADTWPRGTLDSGDPAVHCAVRTPLHYEPGYSYPLIVWFHDRGADERELLTVLPHISERNYAGLSLRGPLPVGNGLPGQRRWSLADGYLNLLEDELAVCLSHVADRVNIHWDRVIAAGMGQGATLALRMLLRRPEWFAGAACLGGEWTSRHRFDWWGRYADKPVWLGHIRGWSTETSRAAVRYSGLMKTAGLDVTRRMIEFDDAAPGSIGREVDRWLLQSLCPDSVVT
ncbi:MAG: alpha/beta hydrolase [Planctomycetaceae bacterium]